MTAIAARWAFSVKVVTTNAILVCPSFAETRYFPVSLIVTHGTNTYRFCAVFFMVELHTFFEINYFPGKGGR